jgi:hypothetical protein
MSSTSSWQPRFRLDLETASATAFQDLVSQFREWAASEPAPRLQLSNGWHEITPQVSEQLLRNNRANRKLAFKTVLKYASAMANGEWKRTGQPILINERGQVEDCQHRAWASYLGGHSFPSYVVADIPFEPDLFAYIDDCKPRSAADALYTSGNNGLSPILAAVVKIAFRYDHQALAIMKQPRIRDMSTREILEYTRNNPGLGKAAHTLMGSYHRAALVIGNKAVAAFFAWKVISLYGEDVLDDFLGPLGSGALLSEDDPVLALRNRLIREGEQDDDLRQPHRLALLIKGFNMHMAGVKTGRRGLYVRDNERFPRFEEPDVREAA